MNTDPRFTAYALNEMEEQEARTFLNELKENGLSLEEIEKQAQEIRNMGSAVKNELAKEENIRVSPAIRENIISAAKEKKSKLTWILGGLSSASVIALTFMVLDRGNFKELNTASQVFTDQKADNFVELDDEGGSDLSEQLEAAPSLAKSSTVTPKKMRTAIARKRIQGRAGVKGGRDYEADQLALSGLVLVPGEPIANAEQFNREAYDKIDTNQYKLVENNPLSTLSVDVDTASYANMRRFLLRGQLPPKDSLRVEELINYFHYDYDFDHKDHPIAIKVNQTESSWTKGRKIVRVALKADSPSNLTSASKNLVFLMDVSGSMSDPKKLPLLKESMKLLLRKLKKTDTISLVVYAGAAGVVLEPTEVRNKLKILKALENLSAGGSTNGGAGIKAAYKMAKQGFIKNGVNRVILATDGDFNVGTSSQSELIEMIEQKAKQDIFLTVVGLGMGNYQDALLEKISNRGNGNYAYIDSLSEANKLFNIDLEKNLTTVAKDVKVQVEFNPNTVAAYRLIGYENRVMAARDFNDDKKDAGEMGAGHTVTVLYEIIPTGEKLPEIPNVDKLKYAKVAKSKGNTEDLLTVKVRYKNPTEDKSTKFDTVLKSNSTLKADRDMNFAIAVASFGMKLRNDTLVKDIRYRDIENLAKNNKGKDPYDFREEFLEMVDLAKDIDN
jgi:Ca-activated chloride channel family protein